jgi:hypothetical protein
MENEKLVLNLPGDKVLIGSHFHTLEDRTTSSFRAQNIDSFCAFAKDASEDLRIISNPNFVALSVAKPDRHSKLVASCKLMESATLQTIQRMANRPLTLAEFTEFLDAFRPFGGDGVGELLSNLRRFKLKKIQSVEVVNDTKGNYGYKVAVESFGADDFTPPDTLSFSIPMFRFHEDRFEHSFRLFFDHKSEEGKVNLFFTLKSFTIEDDIESQKITIITDWLKDLPQKKFWGEEVLFVEDDSWRYLPNPEVYSKDQAGQIKHSIKMLKPNDF